MGDSFVHLQVASGYSLRHGASTPQELVEQAAAWGQDAMALTDRNGVYGAVRFLQACAATGVRPILGVDLAVESCFADKEKSRPRLRTPVRGGEWVEGDESRVTFLARGRTGWASLCQLVSTAHLDGDRGKPLVRWDHLREHADGLVALLGPQSELAAAITNRRTDIATEIVGRYRNVFPVADHGHTNLAISVVCHLVPDEGQHRTVADSRAAWLAGMSVTAAARLAGWAYEQQLPTVLANAVRHARPEQVGTIDVLDAIRRLVPLSGRHLDRGNAEGYVKSGQSMRGVADYVVGALGGQAPGFTADRWLAQTRELAESCVLNPRSDLGIGSVSVPELDVIRPGETWTDPEHVAADQFLRTRCEAAVAALPRKRHQAKQRLQAELAAISEMKFAGYFLTVAEVVDLIKSKGVRVAARGSGAGSLVNYLLGISGVNPLDYGLIMERFMSPLRHSLPDIDIDVESDRRTEIYEHIMKRFGGNRCTCVSMMDTYRVRHAVRDVGAALGMPPNEIDSIAKTFPHIRARDARSALQELPELRDSGLGKLAAAGRLDQFLNLVESLDGLPRHIALHPCGVVLSNSQLLQRTPVEASWQGFPMSQFDKDDVEEMGFLKLDVLGIRMQSAMAHATAEIARTTGEDVDIDAIPFDDPPTFSLIQEAKTLGCFQIESPGQRELVGKFAPQTFADLIIDISLFRPGPVKSDMITPFLNARHGWGQPEYLHDSLQPILQETAGVVVFHEQVIKILATVGGCSLAEADEKRRDMGSPEGQQAVRAWLYPAAQNRGYTLPETEGVWDVLQAFASFGFCKAHAAAFALPTYQSAWLKTHYPAAFYAGILTHDPGMYPKRLLVDDARNHGVTVAGVDVNESDQTYRVTSGTSIRLPLAEIKGIATAEQVSIIAGRPYQGLADFWHRSGATRPTAERLVLAGAFDRIHSIGNEATTKTTLTRRDLLLQVGDLDRYTRSLGQRRGRKLSVEDNRRAPKSLTEQDTALAAKQQSQAPAIVCAPEQLSTQLAFDLADEPDMVTPSGLPEMTTSEIVRAEVEILGMDISAHVISFYGSMLTELGVSQARDLLGARSGSQILVAGVKVATQTPPVRGGRRVVFLTVDDATGPIDATFFEDVQGEYASTVFSSWLLLVRGTVRRTGPKGISLRATGCWELGSVRALWQEGGVEAIHNLLADSPLPNQNFKSATTSAVGKPGDSAGGMTNKRRVLVHASGYRMSPYADIKPAGQDPKKGAPENPPSKLWHSSPGSSGW